jgi:hypothetical protein
LQAGDLSKDCLDTLIQSLKDMISASPAKWAKGDSKGKKVSNNWDIKPVPQSFTKNNNPSKRTNLGKRKENVVIYDDRTLPNLPSSRVTNECYLDTNEKRKTYTIVGSPWANHHTIRLRFFVEKSLPNLSAKNQALLWKRVIESPNPLIFKRCHHQPDRPQHCCSYLTCQRGLADIAGSRGPQGSRGPRGGESRQSSRGIACSAERQVKGVCRKQSSGPKACPCAHQEENDQSRLFAEAAQRRIRAFGADGEKRKHDDDEGETESTKKRKGE